MGAFMAPEPLWLREGAIGMVRNPYGTHPYRYALGNPVRFQDKSGRVGKLAVAAIIAEGVSTAIDVGVLAYDAVERAKDPSWTNLAVVGSDVVAVASPTAQCRRHGPDVRQSRRLHACQPNNSIHGAGR